MLCILYTFWVLFAILFRSWKIPTNIVVADFPFFVVECTVIVDEFAPTTFFVRASLLDLAAFRHNLTKTKSKQTFMLPYIRESIYPA